MDNQVNRVLLAFKQWDERQKQMEQALGHREINEHTVQKLKLAHLMHARNRLTALLNKEEMPFLVLLNGQIGKLQKMVYPNSLQRLFIQLKDQHFDRPRLLREQEQEREANLDGIREQLRSIGFGGFAGALDQHLKYDSPNASIQLEAQLDPRRSLQATLRFERGPSEAFIFKGIDAAIRDQDNAALNPLHEFKLVDWPGLQIQHIRNLLEGRSVRQYSRDVTGGMNHRWLELDLSGSGNKTSPVRQYLDSYGYNLESQLGKLIPEERDRPGLIQELENGNRVSVKGLFGPDQEPVFIEADPSQKSVRVFDAAGQMLDPAQLKDKVNLNIKEQVPILKKQLMEKINTVRKKRQKISLN